MKMTLKSLLKNSAKPLGICLCVAAIFVVCLVYNQTNNSNAQTDTLYPAKFKISPWNKTNYVAFSAGDPGYDYFKRANVYPCHTGPALMDLDTTKDLERYSGCSRVLYNRVPKCGSRTVVSTFRILSQQLKYTFVSSPRSDKLNYFTGKRKKMEFGRNFSDIEEPFLYTQHLHYLNFTELNLPAPIYINVIRDPVERVISHFYYKQYGSTSDPQIPRRNFTIDECFDSGDRCPYMPIHQLLPFFCGQTKDCRRGTNQKEVLQGAKRTARTAYLVVGITEDLPAFMEVLESLVPQFFYNATTVFNLFKEEFILKSKTIKKPEVSLRTKQRLKDMLPNEYDFYKFAKQRFYTLYQKIQSIKKQQESPS